MPPFHLVRMTTGSDGVVDPGWRITSDEPLQALATDRRGDIWTGGRFTSIGGERRDGLARFSEKLFANGFDGP